MFSSPSLTVARKLIVLDVQVFYSSMLPLLSRKEVTVVFANIEDLLLTNTVRFILHPTASMTDIIRRVL